MGQWLVLARDDEGRLHRSTVEAPMKDQAFPAASVRIEGGAAIVEIEGVPTRTITIEAQPASVEPVR
jgi:hypothetical protein